MDILLVANTKQATAALAKTQGQLVTTGKTATATSATMKKAMLGIGLAAGAAGVALFKVGEEFDDAFDKISTRTGATGREMRKLKGVFRDVVSDVPASFDDAATAVGDLNTRLGLSGKPLKAMSKQVTELSRITETDVEGNIRSIARAFVDWEVATKDQSDTLDGFFRLSQKSGVSVAGIADSIQKFGSPLRNLGFSLEESAAMFATFERAGVNTQTMVPGLKLAIANLVDPTEDLSKSFDKLGINARKPEDGIRQVFALLSGDNLNQVEKMSLAMEVFGSRAGADMAEAIRQGRFEVDKFIDVMKNGEGTIREQGRRTMDLSEQWTLFTNNLKLAVEPVARKVFKGLGDLMKDVSQAFKKEGLQGVIDLLLDKLGEAIPKLVGMGGKLAKAIFEGLVQAPIWTKLAAAAWIVKAMGGFAKLKDLGKGIGTTIGRGIGAGIIIGLLLLDEDVQKQARKILNKVKETVTGELLDASSREEFAHSLTEWFGGAVDGADLTFQGRKKVQVATEFGKLIFNADTQKLVRVSNQKLKDLVGLGIQDVVTEINSPKYQKMFKPIADAAHTIEHPVKQSLGEVDKALSDGATSWGRSTDKMGDKAKALRDKVNENINGKNGLTKKVGEGLGAIVTMTNNALTAFGVKKLAFDLAGAVAAGASGGNNHQRGGIIKAQSGVMVPGSGSGDKVPAMLEPGEVVLNRKAVAAMGGANKANAINRMIPRFAGGGVVFPHRDYPMLSGDTDMNPALGTRLSQMAQATHKPIYVTSGGRTYAEQVALQGGPNPAAAPGSSHHEFVNGAIAADISPGYGTFGGVAGKYGMVFNLLGIGEPWHIELAQGVSGAVATAVEHVKRVLLDGPDGPLKDLGQSALDRVRKAANAFIDKQMPEVSAGGAGGVPGNIAGAAGSGADLMKSISAARGWSFPDWWEVDRRETGHGVNLINPTSTARLRGQFLDINWGKYGPGSEPRPHINDPSTWAPMDEQIKSMAAYIAERYGNPTGALAHHNAYNWYQRGGIVQKLRKGGKVKNGKSGLGAYAQRVWDAAKGFIPSDWDAPKVRNAATPGHWGYWNSEKGLIKIPDAMKKALLDPKNPRHSFAFANLLHEYAHAAQDFGLDRRTREGAADLWARWIAPKVASAMGESYSDSGLGYPGMAAWVKKNKAAKWWQGGIDPDKTQFRQAGGIVQKLRKGGAARRKPGWVSNWGGPGFWPGVGTQTNVSGSPTVSVTPNYATLPTDISDALFWLTANVNSLEEQISTAETLAGFFTSELGTSLGPTEKAQQIALNDQLLAALLESVSWLNRALGVTGLSPQTRSDLASSLAGIQGYTGQGGKILQVRKRLDELNAPDTPTTTDNSAELISLLQAQLLSTQRALNVSQAQYAVFAGMKGHGGWVGAGQWAIAGERGPEVVTGPAQVYSNRDSAAMMSPNVTINVAPGMEWLRQFISVEVEGQTRKAARGRPLPGVRG